MSSPYLFKRSRNPKPFHKDFFFFGGDDDDPFVVVDLGEDLEADRYLGPDGEFDFLAGEVVPVGDYLFGFFQFLFLVGVQVFWLNLVEFIGLGGRP